MKPVVYCGGKETAVFGFLAATQALSVTPLSETEERFGRVFEYFKTIHPNSPAIAEAFSGIQTAINAARLQQQNPMIGARKCGNF